ncbi:hypothetical protein EON83_03560 [bacterium]|nr:MAG: hypothetical protein EON83_03560 [bacterium]
MSFKQQLRDWLGGLWHDFWHVPYRQVLAIGGTALLAIIMAVWRTSSATNPSLQTSYRTFSPLLIGLMLLLVIAAIPKRSR